MRAILDASRRAVADVVTGRRNQYPTPEELATEGLRAAGVDDLKARPRAFDCACFLPEQHCPECDRAALEVYGGH